MNSTSNTGRIALLGSLLGLAGAALGPNCTSHGGVVPPGAHGGTGSATSGTGGAMASTVASSSAGTGGGGGAVGSSWADNPALWKAVTSPLEQSCGIAQAKLPSASVPRRTWTGCGVGCTVASVFLPGAGQVYAYDGAVTASEYGGEIYYRVTSENASPSEGYGLDEVSRLSDDEPVTLLRHAPWCDSASGDFSPFFFAIQNVIPNGDLNGFALQSMGAVGREIGADVGWAHPGFDITAGPSNYFSLEHSWGVILGNSVVQVALTPGSSALTTVFSSLAYELNPAHRDDLLAWSDWESWSAPNHRARLRIWTPSTGTTVLVQPPGDVVNIAITDDRFVWMEATGLQSIEGKYESASLFYSPRTTDPLQVKRMPGPAVPHTEIATQALVAYGDFAATVVGSDSGSGIVVANLVSQQVWLIPDRPGNHFFDVLAMNATSLLLNEHDPGSDMGLTKRLVRLDLSKLDDLAKGWK